MAVRFFEMLYAHGASTASSEALITIWSLPDKHTSFHGSAAAAAKEAKRRAHKQNTYFGVGLRKRGISRGRGDSESVVAIPALWIDVDFQGPGHAASRKNLPPGPDGALGLLRDVGTRPSLIVATGGGFHAYWLLTELTPIEGNEDRAHLTNASRQWYETIQKIAADRYGWSIDAAWDLARVLRVPGTKNHKLKPATIVGPAPGQDWEAEPQRYELDYILEHAIDIESVKLWGASTGHEVSGGLILGDHSGLFVTSQKRDALCSNDPKFKKTWEHVRSDLSDTSMSGYDMALAGLAVRAGWADQEIADLIYMHRSGPHGENPEKAQRLGYVVGTIAKARSGTVEQQANQKLASLPEQRREDTAKDPAKRTETLQILRRALKIPIKRVLQHGAENADFYLVLDDGRDIAMGSATAFRSQRSFGDRVFEALRQEMPGKKPGVWKSIVARLGEICELIENPDTTRVGQLRNYLDEYRHENLVYGQRDDKWWGGLKEKAPFMRDGCLHVNVPHLRSFIRRYLDDKIGSIDLLRLLRAANAERVTAAYRVPQEGDKPEMISGRFWRIPNDFFKLEK